MQIFYTFSEVLVIGMRNEDSYTNTSQVKIDFRHNFRFNQNYIQMQDEHDFELADNLWTSQKKFWLISNKWIYVSMFPHISSRWTILSLKHSWQNFLEQELMDIGAWQTCGGFTSRIQEITRSRNKQLCTLWQESTLSSHCRIKKS